MENIVLPTDRGMSRNLPSILKLSIFLFSLLSISHTLYAKPVWEKKWIEVTTPNFVILSELSEKKTRKLALELEGFRTVVESMTSLQEATKEKIPTYITVFKKKLYDLGYKSDTAGAFVPGLRDNHMIVFSSGALTDRHIIQHEYTHFLIRNYSAVEYPIWFDEGFSELFSTVRVKEDYFTFGDVSKNRIDWLSYHPWMSFNKLLQVTDTNELRRDHRAIFYAQAWALIHYLHLGREGHKFQAETAQYLTLRKQGKDNIDAFEEAYSLPVKGLKIKIRKYLSRQIRYYKISFKDSFMNSIQVEVNKATADGVATRIGQLCLYNGEYENAKKYYSAAINLNPDNAVAHAGIGDVYKFLENYSESEPFFQKAIELDPNNPLLHLDYGQFFYHQAEKSLNIAYKLDWYEQSKKYFAKSLELNNESPEALVYYALAHLKSGVNSDRALDKALKAHRLLPSNASTKLTLAQAYMQMGFNSEAKKLLLKVLAWSHSSAAENATELLRRIDPNYTPQIYSANDDSE